LEPLIYDQLTEAVCMVVLLNSVDLGQTGKVCVEIAKLSEHSDFYYFVLSQMILLQ